MPWMGRSCTRGKSPLASWVGSGPYRRRERLGALDGAGPVRVAELSFLVGDEEVGEVLELEQEGVVVPERHADQSRIAPSR